MDTSFVFSEFLWRFKFLQLLKHQVRNALNCERVQTTFFVAKPETILVFLLFSSCVDDTIINQFSTSMLIYSPTFNIVRVCSISPFKSLSLAVLIPWISMLHAPSDISKVSGIEINKIDLFVRNFVKIHNRILWTLLFCDRQILQQNQISNLGDFWIVYQILSKIWIDRVIKYFWIIYIRNLDTPPPWKKNWVN